MKVGIFITEIRFDFESIGYFGGDESVQTACVEAHVSYQITKQRNIIHGTLEMPFDEYEVLNHRDLTQRVFEEVQKSVKL